MQPNYQIAGQISDTTTQQHRVLRNTYFLLALAMLPTAIGGFIGVNINFGFMRASPILSMVLFFGVFYGLMFLIEKNRNSGLGVGLMLLFSLLMGVMLGPLLQVAAVRNAGALVVYAAVGTAAIFFGLALIASSAKRNFGFLSKFLMIGFFVLLISVLANAFLQLPVFALVISGGFMLFSSAAIVFTINQIVRGGETNYISATLTLYVSIYNLFTSLLHILLSLTGQRN